MVALFSRREHNSVTEESHYLSCRNVDVWIALQLFFLKEFQGGAKPETEWAVT
jgi:hypothetical protein